MSEKQPITVEGLEKIEAELDHLVKVEREELKVTIAEARELENLKKMLNTMQQKKNNLLLKDEFLSFRELLRLHKLLIPQQSKAKRLYLVQLLHYMTVKKIKR